jgi:pimeloyl-ACP methyl ester carboxylesterase
MVGRVEGPTYWLRGVPEDKAVALIPVGWFETWAEATWGTDLIGAAMRPPVLRAPNGVLADGADSYDVGKPYYDPAKITAPTLLIQAEWDQETPPYMAQTLFQLLKNAPDKRYVLLGEGTHRIMMERNRLKLFEEVQAFLNEGLHR